MLSRAALAFGPPEYFALIFLGLSLVVSLSGKDIGKGLLAALFGLLTAVVGLDPLTGVARLTFGSVELMAGIDFVPIIMGLFAISEILSNVEQDTKCILDAKRIEWLPTWQDIKDTWAATMLRSGGHRVPGGPLPGLQPGRDDASWPTTSRNGSPNTRSGSATGRWRRSRRPKGPTTPRRAAGSCRSSPSASPRGRRWPCCSAGFMMYGLQPGPRLMQEQPALLWAVIASMYIGNVMLLVLNLPLVGLWARMALIPFPILGPMIAVFTLIGAYSLRHLFFDLWICLFFGVVGYLMRKFEFPVAPMVLATVLAQMHGDLLHAVARDVARVPPHLLHPADLDRLHPAHSPVGGQRHPPAPQGQGPTDRARGERLVKQRRDYFM